MGGEGRNELVSAEPEHEGEQPTHIFRLAGTDQWREIGNRHAFKERKNCLSSYGHDVIDKARDTRFVKLRPAGMENLLQVGLAQCGSERLGGVGQIPLIEGAGENA